MNDLIQISRELAETVLSNPQVRAALETYRDQNCADFTRRHARGFYLRDMGVIAEHALKAIDDTVKGADK